jgi:uncharacterized protein YggT (Ycf19 family)
VYVLVYRLLVVLWFCAYMAGIYLLIHIVVARLVRSPESRLLWFFSVVTGPLTRPVRALLPPGTPEARVRVVTLVVLAAVWLATRVVLARLGGVVLG